jgi:nucleoid DNA-binding protein
MKYTRTDMIKVLMAAGIERDNAGEAALLIIRSLADALGAGNVIELRGLGTLEPRQRKARTRYNPQTKEPIHVPARHTVFFRPGQELKKN